MNTILFLLTFLFLCACLPSITSAQSKSAAGVNKPLRIKFAAYDGTVSAGYVDHGAYMNMSGPSVGLTVLKHKILLGMLPALRFKKDRSLIKNALVTPALAIALTYCYRRFALQLPLFYNGKTATKNGRWVAGIGAGIRLK